MNDSNNIETKEHSVPVATSKRNQYIFSRNLLSLKEIAVEASAKTKNCTKCCIAWKVFKCFVFFSCLYFVITQSLQFYEQFHKYPTNSKSYVEYFDTRKSNAKITVPAATLCYRNRISSHEFCVKYPNLCEMPEDPQRYCLKHPHFCPEDISFLVIPKHGYHTTFSKEVAKVSQQLLFNRSDDMPSSVYFSYNRRKRVTVTFVQSGTYGYLKCFSENLRLYQSRKKQRRMTVDASLFMGMEIYTYNLRLYEEESFSPWGHPQAFFSIHPPFNPINPMLNGQAIKSGFTYFIEFHLEEEHLLKPPYTTNCRDYNVVLENINETKPRSQEETGIKDRSAKIIVILRSLDVKISSHDPFYSPGELFSYIGGLVGCWLGISIWSFTGIFETFLMKISRLKQNYRRQQRRRKKRVLPSEEKDV